MNHIVLLRPWKKEDASQLAFIANNKNIWNNLRDRLPHPYTEMDAIQWITHCMKEKPPVNFAVLYNDAVTGSIGLVLKDDVYKKNIEIGYFIGETYWGMGVATEAVKLLLNYIRQNFNVVRIYAEVFEGNTASMCVLQKNGFYLESIRRKAAVKNDVLLDDYVWVKLVEQS